MRFHYCGPDDTFPPCWEMYKPSERRHWRLALTEDKSKVTCAFCIALLDLPYDQKFGPGPLTLRRNPK
jgi:hypothetical protein